jgi:hypothetical protein
MRDLSTRPPVSAEARGRTRAMCATLDATAARIASAIARLPPGGTNPACWKGRVGTARAIDKITRAMPVPPDLYDATMAVWRYLRPVPALPSADPDEPPRPGVVMMVVIAGRRGRLVRCETFGAAFTLHAVGRLLDRSGFQADPVAAMLEAHAALAAVPPQDGERLFDLRAAELPAAGGAFLASPGRFGPDAAPLAIARTWVAGSQTFPQQDRHLAAWRTLLDQPVAA